MTQARYQKIVSVLSRRQPDLSILAENVYKPHNLSAMIRTCDAVGIGEIHAINPTGGVPTYNATSASANKWVKVHVYPSLGEAQQQLGEVQFLATHLSEKAVDYRDVDYTRPSCIIFGNEKDGVSQEVSAMADTHIVIPMMGMVQSLNVSVAAAVILFEAYRQRRQAGLYDKPRLSVKAINDQAYRWLYPKEAEAKLASGLILPQLDEEGKP